MELKNLCQISGTQHFLTSVQHMTGHPRDTGLTDTGHSHSSWPAQSHKHSHNTASQQNELEAGSPCKRDQFKILSVLTSCPYLFWALGEKCCFPDLVEVVTKTIIPPAGWYKMSTLYGVHPPPPLLEEVTKRTWPQVDPQAGPRKSEALHPLLCPWNVHTAHHCHSGSYFKGIALRQ